MMKKEFIPYKQALALKELGFDEPVINVYDLKSKELVLGEDDEMIWAPVFPNNGATIAAPLHQQAFRWFREKYQLHNGIYPYYDEYQFQIKDFRLPTNTPINGGLMKYEEAELACLKTLIEIIKQ